MKWRLAIISVLALLLTEASPPAAPIGTLTPDTGASEQGEPKFNISIVNQTPQTVQFLLRPKSGEWKTYALGPNEKGTYSCVGCAGAFQISVKTAQVVVTYEIETGTLYAIRVDNARDIYDVYSVQ